ncbi:MAG: DUF3810 family protein [Saprospiraceae bacterium]|nr:DUF3810 family protein [Saprospiraceae bacterium]
MVHKIGIGVGIVSLFIRWVFAFNPVLCESWYYDTVFRTVRLAQTTIFGWIPFPCLWLFCLLFIILFAWDAFSEIPKKNKLTHFAMRGGSFLGWLIALFLWLWGYNYTRPTLMQQHGIQVNPIAFEEIKSQLYALTDSVILYRKKITEENYYQYQTLQEAATKAVEQHLPYLGFNPIKNAPVRQLIPKGILMHFGASGIYFPFTGECNVDAGVHPLQFPFVVAHEFGHANGFTDEGECNFIAYLALFYSKIPELKYSGLLTHWRMLATEWKRMDESGYTNYRDSLPHILISDLDAINENLLRYPDFFPYWQEALYNKFLTVQGVKDGTSSYNNMLMMITAWDKKYHRAN